MNLPYIKIYGEEMLSMLEPFSDAEKGRLFVGMMQYASSGEAPQFSGNERFIWSAIKRKIDIDAMAYANTVEKNQNNGKSGGRGNKKRTPENPVGLAETQKSEGFSRNPENPVGLAETKKSQEQEQEQEKEKEQEQKQEQGTGGAAAPVPISQIQNLFHDTCSRFPTIRGCEGRRRATVESCFREYGLEKIAEVFQKANASDFLCGIVSYKKNATPFRADFDWIIKNENFLKILEGKYDNKNPVAQGSVVHAPIVDPDVNPFG